MQQLGHVLGVLHGYRLPAGHIHAGLETHIGHLLRADPLDLLLQLLQVDVALPREQVGRIVRLVHDDVHKYSARHLLVQLGGGEVHVSGNDLPRLDHALGHDVFRGPPLVRRNDVVVAQYLPEPFDHLQVMAAAVRGVAGIGHALPLVAAHGRRAAVGQKVQVDVFRFEQKGIVSGFSDGFLPILLVHHPHRFKNGDLVRLVHPLLGALDARERHEQPLLQRLELGLVHEFRIVLQ